MKSKSPFLTTTLLLSSAGLALAGPVLRITEAMSSGDTADWFEVTNYGDAAADITNHRVDDSSFAVGTSLALSGVTTIAPGESVVFIEGDATVAATFKTNWSLTATQVGFYSGSGIGLSSSGDGVTLFTNSSANAGTELSGPFAGLIRVGFGTATAGTSFDWTYSGLGASTSPASGQLTISGTTWMNGAVTMHGTPGAVPSLVSSVDLSNYVRVGRYDLPEPTRTALPPGTASQNLLCQEASGVAYNWDTDTLFIIGDGGRSVTQVSTTGVLIDTMSLALQAGAPQGTAFYDPEGITYIGNGQFVFTEERDRQIVKFTYAAGTILTRANSQTVDLGTFDDNTGTEGLSYDLLTGGFICLKEKNPLGLFQTNVDFAAGTATNGSPTTVNSINLFNTALLGMSDTADVFALSNLPGFHGKPQQENLLVIGQENARIVNISRSGVIHSTLNIASDPGNPLSAADQQHEGITMDRSGNIYVVNENGGGNIDHPQLWVYAPSAVPNMAPVAIALDNPVNSMEENISTASPVKVADISITDDGLGVNNLSLSGADAAFFQITGSALYLKSGVNLDFETKSSYAVTVSVDDTTVGATPDASVAFVLTVTDQLVEASGNPALVITEVAPWSSGNSPVGADWFEVTNVSDNAVDITGWKVDDSSAAFASAIALSGITSIAPGESVIFLESSTSNPSATVIANFQSNWFGGNVPAGLRIGTYQGSGIGLSTGGDGLNLFNAGGVLQASVLFGASDSVTPYQTFDNTLALDDVTLSLLSEVGSNGAFVAANSAAEIGSPGYAAPGILRVTEVSPWSSGSSPLGADWFEVTNSGARAVDITGWKVDDSSESPVAAVPLAGITRIAPGESVIFIETSDLSGKAAEFRELWFGANPPAGLQIGSYAGGGIGLSTGGDAVNLYDTASPTPVRRANVSFGIAPSSAPFGTFDNSAGLDLAAVTLKSVPGLNQAFIAANDAAEIGSPGLAQLGGPAAFGNWLAAKGFSSFGLGSDSDHDGITDGVEFFFNQNPNSGGASSNMPQLVANGSALEMDFTRLTDAGGMTGRLQLSGDLTTWSDAIENLDYSVASTTVNGDETSFTYALNGTGPSAPGVSQAYLTPDTSTPVGASLGGVRVINEGLVGVGRLDGENFDSFGETQGAASGLFVTGWEWDGSQFNGTFQVLPDRGYGDGTSNYAARLHRVAFSFSPYYGASPVAQGQIVPSYVDSVKFTYQDGPTTKFTTGLNPTGTAPLLGQTVGTVTAANGPSGAPESLLSMDAEALHLFADGSGFISDEYGTYIARFNAAKEITGITQLPESARPHKPVATLNFDSFAAPDNGRRNNQGLEGMSVTPDGTRLFALMQSALVQDTDGSKQQTRNHTRLFVYDIAGANRETPVLIGEYVVALPQIDLNGNGSGLDGTAAQSEIVAIGDSSFLMLPRDGNGLGKGTTTPIVMKSVRLVEFASATNILGVYDAEGDKVSPAGVLAAGVKAAASEAIINLIDTADLAKFGMNVNTAAADANTLNEKIEGMALVPDLSTPQTNDFFLFIANDNDFQSSDVRMLDAAGTVVSRGDGRLNAGITNDAMYYAWRLVIDAGGKKFFRMGVE
ncbi:MAG: esterase-like activity of phytase family protein [Verrucomicrobiota bacterium]